MAVNVTVRDIVDFPGGTAKTVTVDIIQVVPVAGQPLEGDEIWVSSATTAATASGSVAIQDIFKNQMKRGWLRSSGLITGNIDIGADSRMVIAIDEAIGSGLEITLTAGNNLLAGDIAADIEAQIKASAEIGLGGSKAGNLSYLNVQIRFTNGRFQIESGTLGESFTGASRSSVKIGAPSGGTDIRAALGFDIIIDSQTLASRQIIETDVTATYSAGDLLTVGSTAGLATGDSFSVENATNTDIALVSGVVDASTIQFTTSSGGGFGLAHGYAVGSLMRKLQLVDVADPVSATTTVDELYRFQIDSIVNQVDFSV